MIIPAMAEQKNIPVHSFASRGRGGADDGGADIFDRSAL